MKYKKILSILMTTTMAISLVACGSTQTPETSGTQPASDAAASEPEGTEERETDGKEQSALSEEIPSEEKAGETDSKSGSNILVACFSLAGEQYGVGVVEEGNTSIIARMIAEQTGADLFAIEAVTPYPDTYNGLLSVSQEEMKADARPEIVGTVENMADYDTVFIGYPNWWGDMPMIVYHFLESYDFAGKTVIPFCTHGGSGLSGTESAIAELTGADMLDGFAILGETAQNDRERSKEEVSAWLHEIGVVQ